MAPTLTHPTTTTPATATSGLDVVIVGAGLVGLATALALQARRPGLRLAVLDKESDIATHQSGRNSGVIHAGIYYVPGSLKARLCVAGSAAVKQYCAEHDIPVRAIGKLIVATDAAELARLDGLLERGRQNGVEGLELVGPERIRELSPECVGLGAIWSPGTSIVDFGAVARAYAEDVVVGGGVILRGHEVTGIVRERSGVVVETSRGSVAARRLIGCAGQWADRLARLDGGSRYPAIVPFRGNYWRLRPSRVDLAPRLIYPVPDPRYPFLGVHFTPRIDGDVWLGPNALLATGRAGYRRRDVSIPDLVEIAATRGFWAFARRHWRTGVSELLQELRRDRLVVNLRRFVPEVGPDDIVPGPAGIRAQALGRDGSLLDDFVFDDTERAIHVRNAPSPAATASLEIGRHIADRAFERFGLGG